MITARAVTFDFYNTLVYHRAGTGRGSRYREYLAAGGLTSGPWEHQVLYDVFDYYAHHYQPSMAEADKVSFWTEFTRRLFERTGVRAAKTIDCADHAQAIRAIMGPGAFALFDEVPEVLDRLKRDGLRLAVISDWPAGLRHFCDELGIGSYFDTVVASSEAGCQKPDPQLFDIARASMQVAPDEVVHVGDQREDVEGARAAAFSAVLVLRKGEAPATEVPVISNLRELLPLIQKPRAGA